MNSDALWSVCQLQNGNYVAVGPGKERGRLIAFCVGGAAQAKRLALAFQEDEGGTRRKQRAERPAPQIENEGGADEGGPEQAS